MDAAMNKNTAVLVTAGDFRTRGGWVLDTQFMGQMGAPYLLAHGLGRPVSDAQAAVRFKKPGKYHAYVYTFNWVAPWKPQYAPGVFQVLVNGEALSSEFGSQGENWGWQYGGAVSVDNPDAIVTLHDLTGFEGRCGLVLFTENKPDALPDGTDEIYELIDTLKGTDEAPEIPSYDLVVCGGGIAGCCAALSAARRGLSVALIQDRPLIGGNNSSEVRVWLGGVTNLEPFPGLGNIVSEFEQQHIGHYGSVNRAPLYEDDRKLSLLSAEQNITLYLSHILTGAVCEGGDIREVRMFNVEQSRFLSVRGALFVDATGDGTLGALCGADYEVTTNGHMGMTNFWYVEDTGKPQEFPRCPWAIDLSDVEFPGRGEVKDVYGNQREISLGCWFWEGGCELDPIEKAEYARDLNLRAMYGAFDTLKNVDHDYETYKLGFSAYIGGKRESRRLIGDLLLTKADVAHAYRYEDGCIPSTWDLDVHYPDKRFYGAFKEGDGFLTKDYRECFETPYFIPYRCLYSRNVGNLFMAGRDVSVSHDALGTARVMRTGGMMGEVVGVAAKLCREHGASPRQIYEEHLEELMDTLKAIPKQMALENRDNF